MMRFLLIALLFSAVSCVGHESEFARSLAVRSPAELILMNGKIVSVDQNFSIHEAVAIRAGRFVALGNDGQIRSWVGPRTRVVNLGGRTVIPGLIDSHIHATEGALTWNAELHWERLRTLPDALRQISAAAQSKPAGAWIVVAGGWAPSQFRERRVPTRAELDEAAPDHPVYVQYLREGALLNSRALAEGGIRTDTPDPAGGRFERDPVTGAPTGVLWGAPAWRFAYEKIPRPAFASLHESIRECFRELNRLGITSVADLQTDSVDFEHRRLLGGMAQRGELTVRINYLISPNGPGEELEQFSRALAETKKLPSNEMFRFAGFGETLVPGTNDGGVLSNVSHFAITAEARDKLRRVLGFLATQGQVFHLHATRDETARQLLDVIESVQRDLPAFQRRVTFAHLEEVAPDTLERIRRLGGGVSVQSRLLLAGEGYSKVRGPTKSANAPPLRTILAAGVPLAAGSDAFRSGNYSPFLALWWLVTGKTIGGTRLRDGAENVTREQALRSYTIGGAWFTFEEDRKGSIEVGKFADLAVLDADYLTVPEDRIGSLESLLTLVGGRVVYAAGPFAHLRK